MILNKGFPEENKADIHVTRVWNDNISKHLETEGIAVYGRGGGGEKKRVPRFSFSASSAPRPAGELRGRPGTAHPARGRPSAGPAAPVKALFVACLQSARRPEKPRSGRRQRSGPGLGGGTR